MASTAIRPVDPGAMSAGLPSSQREGGENSDLDVEDLPAAVGAGLRVHPVGANEASIGRVSREFRSYEGVGSTPVCAAALGLLAFGIGHVERV